MTDAEKIRNVRLRPSPARLPGTRGDLCGWAVCLGGNAIFWLLGASLMQFAIFDMLWLVTVSIRHGGSGETAFAEASGGERACYRLGFLVFLLRVVIACDAVTVIVDGLSPNPLG
ncbi:hypothetical protein ACCC98_26785 [Rhizobium pisi]|uniref:hypothetical protein n=1 Tax=Rhizobium pisi TaxID=574561 RepID=UPI0039B051AF